ncbi:MAG: DUF1653 domain-containing protein [bacterium]|nr:DUF1653 domain-containing protein [bacterium]
MRVKKSLILPNEVYKHYKGGLYTVLMLADESTNKLVGRKVVVYISHTYGKIKVRDLNEFNQKIKWPDGKVRPRFILRKDHEPSK